MIHGPIFPPHRGGFGGRGRGRHFGSERFRRPFSFDFRDFAFDPRMTHWHPTFDHRADPFVLPTWDTDAPREMRFPERPAPPSRHHHKFDTSASSGSSSSEDNGEIEEGHTDRPRIRPAGLRRRGHLKKIRCSNKLARKEIRKVRKAIRRKMDFAKDFEVMLDVTGFRRENLKIKFDNNKIVVEGKHAEHPIEFVPMERHFVWKIPLPEDIGRQDIKCRYLEGGILHIVGTKPAPTTSASNADNADNLIEIDE